MNEGVTITGACVYEAGDKDRSSATLTRVAALFGTRYFSVKYTKINHLCHFMRG